MIPVARPWLGEAEIEAAARPLRSGWLTQGPEVAAFETEFATFVGAPHACAVSNCTVALQLALRALGVGEGDEVITVSHSFIATASSVRYCGAIPVFVDIQPGTFNIDPTLIERAITSRTRAILCVHQMGMPCDMEQIMALAELNNLPVVEDAACAVGSEIHWRGQWQRMGRPHGDVACFSFHPRKLLTTGDGGMLTTRRPELDAKFRLWRQHSMSVPDTTRHASTQVVFESYDELGFNYRMTDLQAAVGREQLKRIPAIVARRRAQVDLYRTLLAEPAPVILPEEPVWARSNWQSLCVRLREGLDQRQVMQSMLEAGVSTRRGIMCAHREEAYVHEQWSCAAEEALQQSELAQDRGLILPLYHDLTERDQESVVTALRAACSTPVG